MEDVEELGEGLTWRSLTAIIYSAVVLAPAAIWYSLALPGDMSGAVGWSTALLFSELATLTGRPLKKQEIFIILTIAPMAAVQWPWATGGGIGGNAFSWLIYRSWLRQSSYAMSPLDKLPDWWAPLGDAYIYRNFLDPAFSLPLLVIVISDISYWIADLSLGFVVKHMYVDVESLPFPMQQVQAQACLTLAERKPERMRILFLSIMFSQIYAIVQFLLPVLTGFSVIPIPWIDLTHYIEASMPGACIGIATDLGSFAIGFILPFNVILSMFAGSFATRFIGNYFIGPLSPIESARNLFVRWNPGYSITQIMQFSTLDFWTSPLIGISLAAAILPIARSPKVFAETFRSLYRAGKGMFIWFLLLSFIGAVCIQLTLAYLLVPGIPLFLLAPLSLVWAFVQTLVTTRSIATTGMAINVPYVREGLYWTYQSLSGYNNVSLWVTPLYAGGGATRWCTTFKVAELTGTKLSDLLKATFIVVPIAYIASYVYVQALWSISPMPSGAYPWTQIEWPITATWFYVIVSGAIQIILPVMILTSLAISVVSDLVLGFVGVPFSLISFSAGTFMAPPTALSALLGGLTGKSIAWRWGKEEWNRNRMSVVAGIGLGTGIVATISVALQLVIKTRWILPF